MSGTRIAIVLGALLSQAVVPIAGACSYSEPPSFRQELQSATAIFVFRLESVALKRKERTGGAYSEWVEGQLRVVQVLKGQANTFKSLSFSTETCGGVRLDVGHHFLVATHGQGTSIDLTPDDRSILDVSMLFDSSRSRLISDDPMVKPIFDFLAGKPLPADYPPKVLSDATSILPRPTVLMPNISLQADRER
jgi:hypothetical protein